MKRLDPEKFLKNKYNHLLCALLLLFILSPSLEVKDKSVSFPIAPLILLIVLVAAVRADFPRGIFFKAFLIFAFVSFTLNLLIYFLPESYGKVISILKFISGSISVLFYSTTVYFLSKQLFGTKALPQASILRSEMTRATLSTSKRIGRVCSLAARRLASP